MQRVSLILAGALALLLSFTGLSVAANVVDPKDGSLDVMRIIYDAFSGGHYAYAAACTLVVAVALARKYLGARWQWMHSDAGAVGLVLLGSFGSALVASLAGGGALTLSLAASALGIAFVAAGGYSALKKLVIEPLAPKLPAWLRGPVLWLFVHDGDQTQVPAAVAAPTLPEVQSAQ